jgi:excisionase family DNA binding protein
MRPAVPQLLSPKDFATENGVGLTTTYALLRSGALRACKVGSLTKIRRDDIDAWRNSLPARVADPLAETPRAFHPHR